jgi:hypothetical protein
MEKTMKTTQELDVELALLKIDIEEKRQYEVLSNLKQRKVISTDPYRECNSSRKKRGGAQGA